MACHFVYGTALVLIAFRCHLLLCLLIPTFTGVLRELDCLENHFSPLKFVEVLYASVLVLMIVFEIRLERLLFVWGEKRGIGREEKTTESKEWMRFSGIHIVNQSLPSTITCS